MENLLFSINAVVPIFVIVFIGMFLKSRKIINDEFTSVSSSIVFKLALPAMMFRDISKTDFTSVFNLKLILFGVLGTIIMFITLWKLSGCFIKEPTALGAFVQGAFRSNFAIIGLPIAYNIYGQQGFARSAVLMSFIIPLYNVLAVIILTSLAHNASARSIKAIISNIVKNPLIIGILLAFPFAYFKMPLSEVLVKIIDYLADVAIPLALLGMGGSFSYASVKRGLGLCIKSTSLKLIVSPFVFTVAAYLMGIKGPDLGAVFILFGSPTAVSSYVMAKAMNSDADLAASIILFTTLGSLFTLFTGIFVLRTLGLI